MIKTKRKCDLEECNNPHFAKGFCKFHQYKRPDFKKPQPKNKKPINKKSEKSRVAGLMYTRKRKAFMNKKENKICPVASYFLKQEGLSPEEQLDWSMNLKTTEVHHKAGRVGKLLLATEYWLAVSRKGHTFIHDNPEFSYQKGWLIKSTTV
jgi:hypothetical protein